MKSILYLLILLPLVINAQQGIKWAEGLTWEQAKTIAQKENKYIFVDCYATWCLPCKKMDKEVYTKDSISDYLNSKFLSLKVQMDSSKLDDENVKKWYADARSIMRQYKVTSFPTFLFFSPDGNILNKDCGYKNIDKFLIMLHDVSNPTKQYYTLLNNYEQGRKDYRSMPYLIQQANLLNEKEIKVRLINDYFNYLASLTKKQLYTKENIEFIAATIDHSKQNIFRIFYPNGQKIDDLMNEKGYAKKVVNHVIWEEYIAPYLGIWEGKPEPDWTVLYRSIKQEFGDRNADYNVIRARLKWYQFYGNSSNYLKYFLLKLERYGTDTTNANEDRNLNNVAFSYIFRQTTDTQIINKAINWMEGVVRRSINYPQSYHTYIDTYANLLFKSGRKQAALHWEEKALKIARDNKDEMWVKDYEITISKIKEGKPTWPVKKDETND